MDIERDKNISLTKQDLLDLQGIISVIQSGLIQEGLVKLADFYNSKIEEMNNA